jgi:UDP:flavonoid glycosyltransferase YjiC (YdhE family)
MTHIGRIAQLRPTSSGALPDEKLPPHVEAAVSAGRRLIYLTFGTVTTLNATFAAAVTAASTMDEMVVVTVGSNGNPGAFGSLPANVHIDTFISQSLLLPHCSLVASHAGSGTFLAALSHGLPQLCLPQAADQFRNASACASTGAGIALPGPQATEAAISQALHRLLAEPEFRTAAQLLQAEIATMPAPASVAATLEQLVVNVDHSAG